MSLWRATPNAVDLQQQLEFLRAENDRLRAAVNGVRWNYVLAGMVFGMVWMGAVALSLSVFWWGRM